MTFLQKFLSIFGLAIISVVLFVASDNNGSYIASVNAEDYDYDDYGSDYSSAPTEPQEPTVIIKKVRLSDTVERETVTTTHFDSDGDGIFDEEDAYPLVNDYLIVKDDNLNGIVDSYEQ